MEKTEPRVEWDMFRQGAFVYLGDECIGTINSLYQAKSYARRWKGVAIQPYSKSFGGLHDDPKTREKAAVGYLVKEWDKYHG